MTQASWPALPRKTRGAAARASQRWSLSSSQATCRWYQPLQADSASPLRVPGALPINSSDRAWSRLSSESGADTQDNPPHQAILRQPAEFLPRHTRTLTHIRRRPPTPRIILSRQDHQMHDPINTPRERAISSLPIRHPTIHEQPAPCSITRHRRAALLGQRQELESAAQVERGKSSHTDGHPASRLDQAPRAKSHPTANSLSHVERQPPAWPPSPLLRLRNQRRSRSPRPQPLPDPGSHLLPRAQSLR